MTTIEETFTRRAISDTVRDGRPYVRVEDVETALAHDLGLREPEYRDAVASRVKQGAWMMMKIPAVPEYGPILPQFKEDVSPAERRKHWHGDYGPKARAKHVKGKRSWVYTLTITGGRVRADLVSKTGHQGNDPDDIHIHAKPAKYRMMPKPRMRYTHVHQGDGAPRDLKKHVADHEPFGHSGDTEWSATEAVFDPHEHLSHHPARGVSPETRLDMHPDAAALLPTASRVFFSIEGVLKGDALLSAGEAVFNVPSVTLWDAPELAEFAERLRGKTVYIVPDSDWSSNPQVSSQAFECRERLRSFGIDAHVAAAQPKCGRACEHEAEAEDDKNGVDDFLYDGQTADPPLTPDDLLVLEREKSFTFLKWEKEYRQRVRSDRAKNDIATVWWLALHASRDDGTVKRSAEAMANHVGVDPSVLHDIVVRLIEEGVIASSRPLAHTIHHRHRIFRSCTNRFKEHEHVPGRQCSRAEHVAQEHPGGDPGDDDRHAHTRTVQRQVVQVRQKTSRRYQGSDARKFKGMATVVDWDRLGKDDEGPTFTVGDDWRAHEELMTIREREAAEARQTA